MLHTEGVTARKLILLFSALDLNVFEPAIVARFLDKTLIWKPPGLSDKPFRFCQLPLFAVHY